MGNYSKVYGKVWLKPNKLKEFIERYERVLSVYPKFKELFMQKETDLIKDDSIGCTLHFNPLYNSFKLLGYPSYFEHFNGFFRDSMDLIDYFDIIADVEDCCCYIFNGGAEEGFTLKMFRTDEGITQCENHLRWHDEFIRSL